MQTSKILLEAVNIASESSVLANTLAKIFLGYLAGEVTRQEFQVAVKELADRNQRLINRVSWLDLNSPLRYPGKEIHLITFLDMAIRGFHNALKAYEAEDMAGGMAEVQQATKDLIEFQHGLELLRLEFQKKGAK